jgi:hypothetical protein
MRAKNRERGHNEKDCRAKDAPRHIGPGINRAHVASPSQSSGGSSTPLQARPNTRKTSLPGTVLTMVQALSRIVRGISDDLAEMDKHSSENRIPAPRSAAVSLVGAVKSRAQGLTRNSTGPTGRDGGRLGFPGFPGRCARVHPGLLSSLPTGVGGMGVYSAGS